MNLKRACFFSLLSFTLCIWSCLGVMLLGGTKTVRDAALRGAGFSKQGSVEAYWAAQPTLPPKYRPAELNAPVQSQPAAPRSQIKIEVREYQQSFARDQNTTPPQTNPAPVTQPQQPPATLEGADEKYNEFMTVTRAADRSTLVVYRVQEDDFLRLCDFTVECQGEYYHYSHADLQPGGAVFYGSVNLLGNWQAVGVIVHVDADNHVRLGGIVLEEEVYAIPTDHPLRGEIDNVLVELNHQIDTLHMYLGDQELTLDAIQVTGDELTVVFR